MTGIDVLRMQLNGSFSLVQGRLENIHDGEWARRALPGTSKLGFILWHCARIMDWTVNSAFAGSFEVADDSRWRARFGTDALYGAGISDEAADRLADSTGREDVLEYFGEVRAAVEAWFGRQTDATLDATVPLKANQERRPEYLEPSVWAAVSDLDGLPAWQFLARPCISHIRVHVGEFDVLLGALRSSGA